MNHRNVERGVRVRSALLAVARTCIAKGKPLPTQDVIARAVGIDSGQCSRHFRRLVDEGAIRLRREGRCNVLVGLREP
jgi:Winged helix-turn-helix DNA-binding